MKVVLVSMIFMPVLVVCGTFAVLGVDITGHVFPFAGLGLSVGEDSFMVSFGLTYDPNGSSWALENSLRYFHEFGNVKLGLNFTVIFATDSGEFLYLIGPELGYSFGVGFGRIDFGVSGMMALPFAATDEIKGPVPFVNLMWRSDTLR